MDFLEGLTSYVCDVIGSKSDPVIEITGARQLSLHHASFVLHCLLDYCSSTSHRSIKAHLEDNFRYSIINLYT